MRLGVVEWTYNNSNNSYYTCYSDSCNLVNSICNYAYDNGLQKKLFGNWSSDYRKICERANKIFGSSDDWYAPNLSFIGEYDSEDTREVYKIEYHKIGKRIECAFYLRGSNESDAVVVNLNGGNIDFYDVYGKDGKRKQIDEAEPGIIYFLIDYLGLLDKEIEDGTMIYYIRNVGRPVCYYKKM